MVYSDFMVNSDFLSLKHLVLNWNKAKYKFADISI